MWHQGVAVRGVPLVLPELSKVCSHELFYSWDPAAAVRAPSWSLFSWHLLSETVQV